MTVSGKNQSIAIIGGGAAGTLVALQLLRQARGNLSIQVIEEREALGYGVAYSTPCPSHLLNVPAGKMAAYPDRPDHFLQWVRQRNPEKNYQADDFLPRHLFGAYLEDELKQRRAQAHPERVLTHWRRQAVDLELEKDGVQISLQDGEKIKADHVVLALGNLPGRYPVARPLPFYQSPLYLPSGWDLARLEAIPAKSAVLLIGQGLTAVDVALALAHQGHEGPLQMVSRHGFLPQVHESSEPWPDFIANEARPLRLRRLLRLVRKEWKRANDLGLDWRPVIDSLRPHTQRVWNELTYAERRRFLCDLRPVWDASRHRMPPQSAEEIARLEKAGQLQRLTACVRDLRENGGNVEAVLRCPGETDDRVISADYVINCTGPRGDYRQSDHPLMVNGLARGLFCHDPLALGLQAEPDGTLINSRQERQPRLSTLGTPLKGILWECTAIREIRHAAAALAERLLQRRESD